jgi:hypothetical protein
MSPIPWTRQLTSAAIAGLGIGVLYTASPLTCWALGSGALVVHLAGRGLPADERRIVTRLLIAALAIRVLAIGALAVAGIPWHNDLAVGALSGDEAYNLSRALRTRDALLGFATTRYDYFVIYDEYGRSSYLTLLTGLQMLFGATPYSARLLNGVMFVAGAALLYRLARPAVGVMPATCGLAVLLFLPSLLYSSISLLKESGYFLVSVVFLTAAVRLLRPTDVRSAAVALAGLAACLWLLDDLRRGATVLAVTGVGAGVAFRVMAAGPKRAVAGALLALVALGAVATLPAVQQRVVRGLEAAARLHSGHVFTEGFAYKLLDDGFYASPATPSASSITLTPPQALRFALRSAFSFVVTPFPWELRSARQLAFLPEHLLWYVMVALLPIGLVAAWRRDPLVTSVLTGYALTTAAVVAMTTGNVGTLLRLRGLVTPFVVWMSVLGLCVLIETLAARRLHRVASIRGSHPLTENA